MWYDNYIETLPDNVVCNLKVEDSETNFRFGDGQLFKSSKQVTLPASIANMDVSITTDVVDCDLPLLLSKDAMKTAKVKLDFVNDKVNILGKNVDLSFTSSGHYTIALNDSKLNIVGIAEVLVAMDNISDNSSCKKLIAEKLHKQFAHASSGKVMKLLDSASIEDEENKTVPQGH